GAPNRLITSEHQPGSLITSLEPPPPPAGQRLIISGEPPPVIQGQPPAVIRIAGEAVPPAEPRRLITTETPTPPSPRPGLIVPEQIAEPPPPPTELGGNVQQPRGGNVQQPQTPRQRPVSPKTGAEIPTPSTSPVPRQVLADAREAVTHIRNSTKPSG